MATKSLDEKAETAPEDLVTKAFLDRYRDPATGELIVGDGKPTPEQEQAAYKYLMEVKEAERQYLSTIANVRFVG